MKVVTGVVGNDIHVVANRLIDISLQSRGYEVFNLGVNTFGFNAIEYHEKVVNFEIIDSDHKQSSKRPGLINYKLAWSILKEE